MVIVEICSQFYHIGCVGLILFQLCWGWSSLGLEVGFQVALLTCSSTLVSSLSSSFKVVHSAKVTILLLTQSDDRCSNCWHLKHQILPRGWDLRARGKLICGWVEGIEGGLIELPLLKVCSKGRNGQGSSWGVWGTLAWKVFFFFVAPLYDRDHPPNELTIIREGKGDSKEAEEVQGLPGIS